MRAKIATMRLYARPYVRIVCNMYVALFDYSFSGRQMNLQLRNNRGSIVVDFLASYVMPAAILAIFEIACVRIPTTNTHNNIDAGI